MRVNAGRRKGRLTHGHLSEVSTEDAGNVVGGKLFLGPIEVFAILGEGKKTQNGGVRTRKAI